MTQQDGTAGQGWVRRRAEWVREQLRDRTDRRMLFARLSVPAGFLTAVWKLGLAVEALSITLLVYGLFTAGTTTAKHLLVRQHSRRSAADEARYLRRIGLLLSVVSLAFAAGGVPLMLGLGSGLRYDHGTGLAIATVAFVELTLALIGVFTARRTDGPLVEVMKLVDLAGALSLLALTQTALLSVVDGGGTPLDTGLACTVFGVAAALVGLRIVVVCRPGRGARERDLPARS